MAVATKVRQAVKKVTFSLNAPGAKTVALAGDFNNWDFKRAVLEKSKSKDKLWSKELALKPGRYEYKFVVDGNWINDPGNSNKIWNKYGTENSVIEIS